MTGLATRVRARQGLVRNGLALGLTFAALLTLPGCVKLGGGKAPDHLLTLTAAKSAQAGTAVQGKADSALVVAEPETDRTLAVQRVAVAVDAAQVAYLPKVMWVERPSRLFGGLLAETLRAQGGRLVFSEDETATRGAIRLSGRLLAMGYDAAGKAAVVRFDAVRTDAAGTITTRRFEQRVPLRKPDVDAIGPALNEAANAVAGQVADWVG